MRWPDVCVVFDCSSLDSFATANFAVLRAALSGLCHVRMLLHWDESFSECGTDVVRLTTHQILHEVRHTKKSTNGLLPGNPDLKLVRGLRELPDVDVLIRLEYDVVCLENISESFDQLINIARRYDFAASYIYEKNEITKDWIWWDTLLTPEGCGVPSSVVPRSAFLPLMALSKQFLRAYEASLAAGLAGHYEVTMPTLAAAQGFQMLDISSPGVRATALPHFNAHAVQWEKKPLPMFLHPVKHCRELEFVEFHCATMDAIAKEMRQHPS